MYHIKETIITLFPTLGWLSAALETSNLLLKAIAGGLGVIYLTIRIIIAYKELKNK